MKKLLIALALALSGLSDAYSSACPSPQELDDILDCLKDKHTLVLTKNFQAQSLENLHEVMGQWPNPILDVQSVHSGSSRQTQVVLTQKIDLAGKLEALREKGKLIYEVSKNQLEVTKEDVIEQVLLNIHHIMHVHETLIVNKEILQSLSKVISALKRRPALNPEQEASLMNFKLQEGEVRNIIALLEDEEEEILLFFALNGGYSKSDVLKVMEDHGHSLEVSRSKEGLSLNLLRLGLETKLAEKELKLQNAIVYEDISIGPIFMNEDFKTDSEKLFGVAVNIPLPLWQSNGAGKAMARTSLRNSKLQYNLFKEKEDLHKRSLLERIDNLKENLKLLPKEEELMKTHLRVERLYSQGLISPSSFLDSHRIWRDVTSSKLELEEKILKLKISYYRLIGQLNEVHL
jgi:cobalt-zinc-cadmium efflux system outer membrane protein